MTWTSSNENLLARIRLEKERRRRQRAAAAPANPRVSTWHADHGVYVNRDTGKAYTAHNTEEAAIVADDRPRYILVRGGEGGGKSVTGIIKDLERLRRGMHGIMVSPDLPHFKRSLWPEFKRWCPWDEVIPRQRYRGAFDWEPPGPFMLAFSNGATLLCGGIENPGSYEGPNVHFAHFDEARHHKTPDALKVLAGRVRLMGPQNERPQLWLTTTPRKHWLFEYFGPLEDDDEQIEFKRRARDIILRTTDNAANLAEGYVDDRGAVLSEAEKRVILDAEWEDIDTAERFLPSITWWDGCKEDLAPLDARTPIVLAADAGVSNDSFGLSGVSRHPERHTDVAVRLARVWYPRGAPLNFDAIEGEIRTLCATWNVVEIAYDPYQLHQMMTRLQNDGVAWTRPFNQGAERLVADKQLLDLITQRRLAHDGDAELRTHIDNADRKGGDAAGQLRLVKRTARGKIDLAVATSMAAAQCLELNL